MENLLAQPLDPRSYAERHDRWSNIVPTAASAEDLTPAQKASLEIREAWTEDGTLHDSDDPSVQ